MIARALAVEYDVIHLGPAEWGGDKMREVAEAHFAANLNCDYILVHEHAGWYLGYRRDGSIWGTANDAAITDGGPRPTRYSGREERRP